jgi:hypothetical protein
MSSLIFCRLLEAATRFELVNNGFADRCLTTWLRRRNLQIAPNLKRLRHRKAREKMAVDGREAKPLPWAGGLSSRNIYKLLMVSYS